jgi:hypothetical protein
VAPKTIILMCHAEKPDGLMNPDLSHVGRERAKGFCQSSRQDRSNEQYADKSGGRAVMICSAEADTRN